MTGRAQEQGGGRRQPRRKRPSRSGPSSAATSPRKSSGRPRNVRVTSRKTEPRTQDAANSRAARAPSVQEKRSAAHENRGGRQCKVLYAQTMPGVEQIAWLEIRDRFPNASLVDFLFAKDQNGIVLWEDNPSTVAANIRQGADAELLKLRTTEDVFVLVAPITKVTRDWGDLRLVADLLHESGLLGAAIQMKSGPHATANIKSGDRRTFSYRVISRKSGNHQYRRKDFEEACIKGIARRYGSRAQLVDDNAEIEIWANILGSTFVCGLRLSDASMRHRAYKVANLPASLRPSVAAAMVWLTNPQPEDVFLDPMCGSGTLMAERMLMGPYAELWGGDLSPDSLKAARQNLDTLGQPYTLRKWDAAALPLDDASVDKAATNLPFGKQIGSATEIKSLYPQFFKELARVLKPSGRATVLSSEYELIKRAVRQAAGLEILTGYSIAVLGQWGRVYIIEKS
jgi:tRNA (guanine6-N2)-methyltransferase